MEKEQKKALMWAAISGAVILIICIVAFIYSKNLREREQLNAEARREAEKYLQSLIIKCGDHYYSKVKQSWIYGGTVETKNRLLQFETIFALARESDQPLTESDKREGIQWKGEIEVFISGKYREYDLADEKWEAWREHPLGASDIFDLQLYKTGNSWGHLSISNIRDTKLPPQPLEISCSNIPK